MSTRGDELVEVGGAQVRETQPPAQESEAAPQAPDIEPQIAAFFAEATTDGLFPAIAFGLDPAGASDTVGLLTSPIGDFAVSLEIVERVQGETVSPYRFIPLRSLHYIADKNAIMRFWSRRIQGLDSNNPDHRRLVSRFMAYCTASRWRSRAFALVDMVDFSLSSTPQQLSLRMSLGQAINQCAKRMHALSNRGVLPPSAVRGFNRISSGDGFYVWNYDGSPDGHVALFLLMVLLMTHTRALFEQSGSPLQLRAAFGLGEAYTFPYHGPGIPPAASYQGFMPDAVGPALNQLNRFLSVASPGQILVAPFDEPGRQERPGERLNVATMLARIRSEILPAELSPAEPVKAQDLELRCDPPGLLRLTDKHGLVHHCYNVCGKLGHRPHGQPIFLQSIGLVTDIATDLKATRFTAS